MYIFLYHLFFFLKGGFEFIGSLIEKHTVSDLLV